MVKAVVYLEGGGDSKDLKVRCREGFRKLLEASSFKNKMPRLVACGGRNSAFEDFKTAHYSGKVMYVAMLIDSEKPVYDLEKTWEHLNRHDGWLKPNHAEDKQVLFMTTCMETWIVSDRDTLKEHYGSKLQISALPPLNEMEQRDHHEIQESLVQATRECSNAYAKGKRSFRILGKISPDNIREFLPSFKRMERILKEL
ncbi:MAG: DUF4276 family protein [bacterium]